jgi:hypothetical protein
MNESKTFKMCVDGFCGGTKCQWISLALKREREREGESFPAFLGRAQVHLFDEHWNLSEV